MKKLLFFTIAIILVLIIGVLFGCGEPAATTPAATTPAATTPAATTPAATTPAATTPAATTPAATTPAATEAKKYGGTLKWADAMGITSVGWIGSGMFPHGGPFQKIFFDNFMRADPAGNLSPELATKWEVAPDKTSITLTLRQGVKFHDGSDWNATVAKWNIDTCKENNRQGWTYVTSVDVVDDYTIRINMSTYYNTILNTLANTSVISKAAYDEHGEQWLLTHAVGTGPFKFDSYTPDVRVRGVRNDDYWGGKPYLDAVEVYWIMDPTTRAAAFEAGEMDVISADLSKAEYDLKQKGFDVVANMVSIYCLFPDSKNADSPFSSQKVRDAVYGIIDREALTSSLGYGWWTPSNQLGLPFMSNYIKDLPARKYTPDQAKQLLAEAGYPDGFKCKLLVDAFVSDRDAITAIQGYLSQIGITTEIEMMDMGTSATYATKGWNNGLFGAARTFSGGINGMLTDLSRDGAWWVSMDKTDEYDKLYRAALTAKEYDPALSQKAVRYLFDNVTFIPVYTMQRGAVVQPYVHDTGFMTQANFWYWDPAKAWMSK
jgi:peptide/nickel transport system substrate-binding protein